MADENCQYFLTYFRATIDPFLKAIAALPKNAAAPLPLKLTGAQLPLGVATFPVVGRSFVIIDGTLQESQKVFEQLQHWSNLLSVEKIWHLVSGPLTLQEQRGDAVSSLSATYHHLLHASDSTHNFVLPAQLLDMPAPHPASYQRSVQVLAAGEPLTLSQFVERSIKNGFVRSGASLEPGTIRVRGEHVDIAHPLWEGTYTITWYGKRIEHIVHHRGRRSETRPSLAVPPLALPEPSEKIAALLASATVFRPSHTDVPAAQTIIIDSLEPVLAFPYQALPSTSHVFAGSRSLVLLQNHDRVMRYFTEHDSEVISCTSPLAEVPIALRCPDHVLLSEAALFPEQKTSTPRPLASPEAALLLAQLRVSRPAVHEDHGIGIFEGLQLRTIDDIAREYAILRYAQGDTVSVPVEYIHKITPYIGEGTPPLHRLGGAVWSSTKRAAREDAVRLAKELLEIAGRRAQTKRPPYPLADEHERHLDQTFAYTLTPDQFTAWHAVQEDLLGTVPMDRLVVGDVGFGKTEIALRAAHHVAQSGKQVALLAPTTLLVQQHTDTFRQRLREPIGTLSRFATSRQQQEVRKKIASGEVRIVIGTHALLSDKTVWHNLGLVIIDEEQRFGVVHKEKFKKFRAAVDMLSLSATPIPRTLSMAMAGLKNLSVIATPPEGRRSVQTVVGRDSDNLWERALTHELAQQGQVYVVSPKIRGLTSLARRVRTLAPKARVAVAHGQMPSQELARIMEQFDSGKLDVLVSSTIIESGLDVAGANTIIVTRATEFGLADLYQLRGRVGRRRRQGYAYFMYNHEELTSLQRRRLVALTEASRLGSGWTLAQHDLELRGAGNLLGSDQSGTVNAVGAQLYLDLVREASQQPTSVSRHEVDIQLPLPALIPEHYVADSSERLAMYHQLTRATSVAAASRVIENVERRFGPLPPEVTNLHLLVQLQHLAARLGIVSITSQMITPPDEEPYFRLLVTTHHPPTTLRALGDVGRWEVRGRTLSLGVEAITPDLVERILRASVV